MNAEKVCLLVRACITYGHLGYLNLEDQELICLYEECLIISQYFGDIESAIQSYMLLDEVKEKMHCFEESSTYLKTMLKLTEQNVYEVGEFEAFAILLFTLEFYEEHDGFRRIESIAFLFMAKRYELLYNFQKAVECYGKAINIFRNLDMIPLQLNTYRKLLTLYDKLGKYDEMKECSENYLNIAKETRNKKSEGTGYLHLGDAYFSLGKRNDAISSYEESVKIALQIDYKRLLGAAYSKIGAAYKALGKLDQAQKYLESSLKIAKQIGDREEELISCGNLGSVFRVLGKYQEAMDCYQKSLSISASVGDKKSEGIAYTNMGDTYIALSKYYESIQFFKKGLGVFRHNRNRLEEGRAYMQLARVYNNVGKLQDSFEHINKSLAIAIETGDKDFQMSCYEHLGVAHQNLKKYEKAMEYHVKHLNCALEIGDSINELSAYCHIGNVHLDSTNPEEAIKYFEKGLHIAISTNYTEGEGYAYYHLGEACSHLKKYDEAIRNLEKSINIAMNIDNKSIAGNACYELGSVYYHLSVKFGEEGDEEKCQDAKQKSEEKLKEALKCREWKFTHLKDLDDFKISIVDSFIHNYKMLTKVLIERQKTDEALLISDRGRARSLGDILVSKYGVTEERTTSQTQLDITGLKRVLSSNQVCILFFGMPFEDDDLLAWVLSHQKPIVFVNTNSQSLTAVKALQLERGHSNVEAGIQEIICNLVNTFYCKMPRKIQTTSCENRSFESTEDSGNPIVGSEIQRNETLIYSVERNVDSIGKPQIDANEQNSEHLEVLFSLLITPVIQHFQQEEIVIIPDGPLYMVPFAALKDPTTGKYLSETKSIRISPSLATLKALRECTDDYHSKTGALIVGDPDVGKVILEGKTKDFGELPSAKREAECIAAILDAKPLTGSQATKEIVKQILREGVAVIHIAAHGDSEHGHIALAPPPRKDGASIPEEQDYMLTMEEVQEIGVTAQLVVLSCCHSGRGDIKAEGVVGMSRAFLAAGARSVVASLWAIDDEATSRFMRSFYASLKLGKSASKSLQIAMDDIRAEEDYEDPMYWAPFFLIGDDVTIRV